MYIARPFNGMMTIASDNSSSVRASVADQANSGCKMSATGWAILDQCSLGPIQTLFTEFPFVRSVCNPVAFILCAAFVYEAPPYGSVHSSLLPVAWIDTEILYDGL